jgi:hypothetical protein
LPEQKLRNGAVVGGWLVILVIGSDGFLKMRAWEELPWTLC